MVALHRAADSLVASVCKRKVKVSARTEMDFLTIEAVRNGPRYFAWILAKLDDDDVKFSGAASRRGVRFLLAMSQAAKDDLLLTTRIEVLQ